MPILSLGPILWLAGRPADGSESWAELQADQQFWTCLAGPFEARERELADPRVGEGDGSVCERRAGDRGEGYGGLPAPPSSRGSEQVGLSPTCAL